MKVKRWLTEHHNTAQLIMRGNVTPEVQMDWKIEYFSELMHIVENKWHYALFFFPAQKQLYRNIHKWLSGLQSGTKKSLMGIF